MHIRSLALATATFVLLTCGAASAAPTTVQLRVEGASATLFEGPVTTDAKTITKGGNTVVCDGTVNGANPTPGPTATTALDDGALQAGVTWDATFFAPDLFLTRFGAEQSSAWGLAVNYTSALVGGCQLQVHAGDDVLWAADAFGGPPDYKEKTMLRLDGPARAVAGAPANVRVTDGTTHAPVGGATVGGTLTGADGTAAVTLATPGLAHLKAEAPDSIRSNALTVCVSSDGKGDCGIAPPQAVKDSKAPSVRISGPRDGARFSRGPRLLSGTATDDVGVTKVKLALRRHVHGGACRWWSATADRFAGHGCSKKVFFGIGSAGSWSFLLPRRLPAGRYVLDAKAFDRARNSDERFVRGTNRVVFYVGRGYGARTAAAARAAPRVAVLLAGTSKSAGATVRARAALLQVGHRRCKVGSSTPLAALAALLRERRTGYAMRDYGSCSRTNAAAAGQLFVRRIGNDSNRGNDGWFYKVNDRAPEVGAGDPSARVRAGDRVLWFYCLFDESTRSCQRSLRIVADPVTPSGAVTVTVRGYDNAGRSASVAGATVASGAATATTGPGGTATLMLGGAPGRRTITAQKAGVVDAFPVTVRVR
jgi:hypothetical protein